MLSSTPPPPPVQDNAEIVMLTGRDLLPAHHILDNVLDLYMRRLHKGCGWARWLCLFRYSLSANTISVMKTFKLKDGRTTLLVPCHNSIHVEENSVFSRTSEDNLPGLSVEDKDFLHLMDKEIY